MKHRAYASLAPKFDKSKNTWVVDVPQSLNNGTRTRRYYQSETEALRGSAELAFQHSLGGITPTDRGRSTVATMVASYLADKKSEVSKITLRQLAWGLRMLSEQFGKYSPGDITSIVAIRWVKQLDLTTRGRFNVFAVCRGFYNSPEVREAVPVNPFSNAPLKTDKDSRMRILTPAEMQKLLGHEFPDWFKAWLVCGGFAGLRTCEIERIPRRAIDWDYNEIVIRKEDSKGGEAARPRSTSILPAFARHLPKSDLPILEGATKKKFDRLRIEAAELCGEKNWMKNSLRHSFASYHLAHFRDATKTAYELGHTSPTLLYKTYANCVSRRDAEQWWNL